MIEQIPQLGGEPGTWAHSALTSDTLLIFPKHLVYLQVFELSKRPGETGGLTMGTLNKVSEWIAATRLADSILTCRIIVFTKVIHRSISYQHITNCAYDKAE